MKTNIYFPCGCLAPERYTYAGHLKSYIEDRQSYNRYCTTCTYVGIKGFSLKEILGYNEELKDINGD